VNGKRSRGRSGRNKPSNSRNQTFDSSGPDGKVRGTANQVFEKYQALARDANLSGDRIGAENFSQHAEHYYRILSANAQNDRNRPQVNGAPQEDKVNGRGNEGRNNPVHAEAKEATAPQKNSGNASNRPQRKRSAAPKVEAEAEAEKPAINGSGADGTAQEPAET
jgi:hypothetical protein